MNITINNISDLNIKEILLAIKESTIDVDNIIINTILEKFDNKEVLKENEEKTTKAKIDKITSKKKSQKKTFEDLVKDAKKLDKKESKKILEKLINANKESFPIEFKDASNLLKEATSDIINRRTLGIILKEKELKYVDGTGRRIPTDFARNEGLILLDEDEIKDKDRRNLDNDILRKGTSSKFFFTEKGVKYIYNSLMRECQ